MVNLVIVAGGKQTRFKELSVFPKVLLPSVESSSLLTEFISKTRDLGVSVNRYIVINKVFSEQVRTYLKVNNLENEISVIESTNTNGSFNTLNEIKDQLPTSNVLFIWSDLTVTDFKPIVEACERSTGRGIIFTNSDGHYRYGVSNYTLDDPRVKLLDKVYLSSSYSGNVPGIYFLRDLSLFLTKFEDNDNKDLIDAVQKSMQSEDSDNFQVIDFDDISSKLVEYRDLGVYKSFMKSSYKENNCQTRFFNQLTINHEHGTATKRAIDKNYVHLIQKEIEWYKNLDSLKKNASFTPKVFSFNDDSFVMEYLNGFKPLHEVLDNLENGSQIDQISKLYKNLFDAIDQCAETSSAEVPFSTFKDDLKKEIVDKVIDRCEKIKAFLMSYDQEHLTSILDKVFMKLIDFARSSSDYDLEKDTMRYWFCHGDLNGSNVMINEESLEVKFLDPRGYFGNTKVHGWKPYELAKILYCLYGYDDFNLKPQIYCHDWPKIRQSLEYSRFRDNVQDYNIYLMMVGVIYVALAGYISQDIMKANIAYDYGMKILDWSVS